MDSAHDAKVVCYVDSISFEQVGGEILGRARFRQDPGKADRSARHLIKAGADKIAAARISSEGRRHSERTRTEYAGKRSAQRNSSSPPSSRSSMPLPYPTDAGFVA